MLKDGSDSVGALGALNRVYLNIGLFSEEWLLHFRRAHRRQADLADSDRDGGKNSVYWRATEMQTPNMARFFLASTDPHHLKDAPDGRPVLTDSQPALQRGKVVFAERCARCHSSKLPDLPAGLDLENANGPELPDEVESILGLDQDRRVQDGRCARRSSRDDFLEGNFLSTELRVPITLLGINACSPLGDQRDPRQHLGQLLVASRTSSCRRSGRSKSVIR